jgi:antitoxin HigA-1
MPIKNPPHPGDFIKTEIIEAAGLSVTDAAAALQVSRTALSSLVNSKASLSGDMALRIEKAFGVKMDTLMRMQYAYNIAQTRKREHQIKVTPYADVVSYVTGEVTVIATNKATGKSEHRIKVFSYARQKVTVIATNKATGKRYKTGEEKVAKRAKVVHSA